MAQVARGILSDRRFLAVRRMRLRHLFRQLPGQSGYFKRRHQLREAIDELICSWTPPRRNVETVRRSRHSKRAGYGWGRCHSRLFWGMRLHLVRGLDGTPGRAELRDADQAEQEVALQKLPRIIRGGEIVVCDKGYLGRPFERRVAEMGGLVVRPRRLDDPADSHPHLGRIRQRIESVFQTLKDLLSLERHGARTPEGMRTRIGVRLLALAASVCSTTNSAARSAAWSPSWRRRAESIISSLARSQPIVAPAPDPVKLGETLRGWIS